MVPSRSMEFIKISPAPWLTNDLMAASIGVRCFFLPECVHTTYFPNRFFLTSMAATMLCEPKFCEACVKRTGFVNNAVFIIAFSTPVLNPQQEKVFSSEFDGAGVENRGHINQARADFGNIGAGYDGIILVPFHDIIQPCIIALPAQLLNRYHH